MNSEREEFYDSLDDEDGDGDSNPKPIQISKSKSKTITFTKTANKDQENAPIRKHFVSKIPLFTGETRVDKLKINSIKTNNVDVEDNNGSVEVQKTATSNTCLSCANVKPNQPSDLKAKSVLLLPKSKETPNTYWGLFCSRNKASDVKSKSKKKIPDEISSVLSTHGSDSSTPRTITTITEENDGSIYNGPAWDTPSFYANYLPKNRFDSNVHEESSSVTTSSSMNTIKLKALETELDNLRSVSQLGVSLNRKHPILCKSKGTLGTATFAALKAPSLGGLGPDLESSKLKLEKLKKQQEYGKRVSSKNRAKIIQQLLNKKA